MNVLDKAYLKWIGYNDDEIETYEGEGYKEQNQYDAFMTGVNLVKEENDDLKHRLYDESYERQKLTGKVQELEKNVHDLAIDKKILNREIRVLGERVLQLQKDKGCLTDEVNELKEKINRLKTCDSCKKNIYDDEKELFVCSDKTCKHLDKWECK